MYLSQCVALTSGFMASVLNLSLIPFVVVYSSPSLGNYKHCLLSYTVSATIMTVSQVNTLAAWLAPSGGYLFYSTITIYPRYLQFFFIYAYIGGFCWNLATTAWAFMTRLSALTGSGFLSTAKTLLPLLLFSLASWSGMLVTAYTMRANTHLEELYSEQVWNDSNILLSEVGYIGSEIVKDNQLVVKAIVQLAYYFQFMVCVTTTIFVCWLQIRKLLGKIRQQQSAHFKFHHRLYVLLSFQALFPLIFNTAPSGLTFLTGMFQWNLDEIIAICGSILSFAQILDPILTAYLIMDYRRAILRLLGLRMNQIGDSHASQTVSHTATQQAEQSRYYGN